MSFAEGFFTTSANAITARKMEIRDRRAKDRDYLMTYGTQAITKAREGADSVANIAGILQAEYNFSPENIAFLVDKTGVAGITSLYEKVKDFTPQQAKASNFNGLFMGVEDYVYDSEKDLKQQIEKAFGLYKSNVTTDPQENERVGFLARLGLDIFNDSGEEFKTVGGYSIEDARRIAATPASSMSNPLGNIFDTTKLPRTLTTYDRNEAKTFVEERIEAIARLYVSDNNLDSAQAGSKINSLITAKDWASLSAMPELKEKLNKVFFNYEEEYGILGSNPALSYLKKNDLLDPIEPKSPNQLILDSMNKNIAEKGKQSVFPKDINDVLTFESQEELNASEEGIGIINGRLSLKTTLTAVVPDGKAVVPDGKAMDGLTEAQTNVVLGIVKELVDKEVNLQNANRRKGRVANNMSGVEETALRESLKEELLPAAIEDFKKREAQAVIRPNPRIRRGGG